MTYPGEPFAYSLNVRGVHLQLAIRSQEVRLEGSAEPDDILRLHFLARVWPAVAHYPRMHALLGGFWEATNLSTSRDFIARVASGFELSMPDLSVPVSKAAMEKILAGRAEDTRRAIHLHYLEPTMEELTAYCERVLGTLDLLLAPWLPEDRGAQKIGDGRPDTPQLIPVPLLDAFCEAFPFSGFAEKI
jgi:hypothetical protein